MRSALPNFWVRQAGQQAASAVADIGGPVSQRLNQYEFQKTIQHQRTARPIGNRFVAKCRQKCAQPSCRNLITAHMDNGQHQGRDQIAIGG